MKDLDDVATLLQVTQKEFLRYVRAHDVVITTYQDREYTFQKHVVWSSRLNVAAR